MINPLSLLTSAVSWVGSWLPEAVRPSSTPTGISDDNGGIESLVEDETAKPQGWLSWIGSFFRKSSKKEAPDTSGDAELARKLQEEGEWQQPPTESAETPASPASSQVPEQVEVEEKPLQVSVEVFLEGVSSV